MQTLILDSSQISAYYECPTIWANRGIIPINKLDPTATNRPSEPIAAGSLGHKYLEIYYTVLGATGDSALAARQALAFDADAADLVEPQFPLDPTLRALVKQRFCDYLLNYPAAADYKVAVRKKHVITSQNGRLIDTWEPDPLIEKGFSYNLYESKEYLFVLEGRIDFLGHTKDGTAFWLDHKWQMREHMLHEKSIQFRNYALATGLSIAIINYVRLHKKIEKNTFSRQPLSFGPHEMRYWRQELIEKYVEIAKQVAKGEFPKNRNSCQGGWGKPCMFNPLCNEYNPIAREAIRKRDYMERKEWRPW